MTQAEHIFGRRFGFLTLGGSVYSTIALFVLLLVFIGASGFAVNKLINSASASEEPGQTVITPLNIAQSKADHSVNPATLVSPLDPSGQSIAGNAIPGGTGALDANGVPVTNTSSGGDPATGIVIPDVDPSDPSLPPVDVPSLPLPDTGLPLPLPDTGNVITLPQLPQLPSLPGIPSLPVQLPSL